jgi:hypothetical protein
MLINKSNKVEADDVATFKMVNGDEIVAKVVAVTDAGDFVLNRPFTVIPSGQGMGLLPLLLTADENQDYTVRSQHVLMHGSTVKEIQNHYIKMTTGIELVTPGSIIK